MSAQLQCSDILTPGPAGDQEESSLGARQQRALGFLPSSHLLPWVVWECHLCALQGRITTWCFPRQEDPCVVSPGWVFLCRAVWLLFEAMQNSKPWCQTLCLGSELCAGHLDVLLMCHLNCDHKEMLKPALQCTQPFPSPPNILVKCRVTSGACLTGPSNAVSAELKVCHRADTCWSCRLGGGTAAQEFTGGFVGRWITSVN